MIVCERRPGTECEGHYFELGDIRGIDYCDGSSDIEHPDGTRLFWDREGNQLTPPDDRIV